MISVTWDILTGLCDSEERTQDGSSCHMYDNPQASHNQCSLWKYKFLLLNSGVEWAGDGKNDYLAFSKAWFPFPELETLVLGPKRKKD